MVAHHLQQYHHHLEESIYNYQKNKLMLFNFCENSNIVLRQKEITDLPKENFPLARDNDHPGPDWHANIAGILCER